MDFELRELERLAAGGDEQARQKLVYRRFIAGELDPANLFITTKPHDNLAIAHRVTYRPEFQRWEPDGEGYVMNTLLGAADRGNTTVGIVFAEDIVDIHLDGHNGIVDAISYADDPEIDEFIENYGLPLDALTRLFEEGAVIIRNPTFIKTVERENLYHSYDYHIDHITEMEDPVRFDNRIVTMGVKLPGQRFAIFDVYNMFENVQMMVHDPPETGGEMEFFRPGYLPGRNTGFVDRQKLFDNVFMFLHEEPYGLEPNFNVLRPPMFDMSDPRIAAMLDRVDYVDPNIEMYTKPSIQTIYGPAVFIAFNEDWDDLNYDHLPWPWNEIAREDAEGGAGYPAALEIGSLTQDQIIKIDQFISSGRLPG